MIDTLKKGISSNMLKTIAIIAMVIDHIAFYFSFKLSPIVYTICRGIGRISMPIFVYILVQGFFHTKNFNKYVARIGVLAIITQILISILMVINIKFVPSYVYAKQVYITANILFTFAICLITMKILHEDILIKKWPYNKNLSLKIIAIIFICIACIFIPLDYGVEVVILSAFMYYLEKFKIKVMIEKNSSQSSIKNILLNSFSETKIQMLYLGIILATLFMLVIYFNAYWTVLLAIVPISLYNGERGKISLKYVYYIIFPLQHVLFYSLAMLLI